MSDKAKVVNRTLERAALKAISKGLPSSKALLSRLDESFFYNTVNKTVFKRIKSQTQTKNEIPSWRGLCHDPALDTTSKEALANFTENVIVNKKNCDEIFDQLYAYRRKRILNTISEQIKESLLKDGNDEHLIEQISNQITQARAKRDKRPPLALGKNALYKNSMERVLSGEAIPVWPSGFKDFDARGGGFAIGSLILIGGYTGFGKTNLMQTLDVNFADYGLRVGEYSLEMDQEETLLRRMAAISSIAQDRILKNELTPKEKDHIRACMDKRIQMWARKNAGVYTHTPVGEATMATVLAETEPYDYNVLSIDYAGLFADVGGKDFWQKLGETCRMGKVDANRRRGLTVILIQTNKEDEAKLSSFMMTHADYALFIKYSPEGDNEDFSEIIMPKARKIKKAPFVLAKEFTFARFANYTGTHVPGGDNTPKKVSTDKPSVRVQGGQGQGQGQGRQQVAKTEIDPDIEAFFADADPEDF